jgi:PmbA protein
MLGQKKINEICQFLLARCEPAKAEVWVEVFDESLTRFANNAIHQNVNESNARITLRVSLEGRQGAATTNRIEGDALDLLAQDALDHACCSPVDPNDPGLAPPLPVKTANAFDEATAACTPEQRAAPVKDLCQRASEKGLTAAGAFSTSAIEIAAANTSGVFAYHPYTCAEFQVTAMGEDSSGRGQAADWRMDRLAVETLGEEAIQTALDGRGPRAIPPGEYPVILMPYAVLDLVSNLNFHGVNGLAVVEGRSWMVGRQGKLAASPLVSLWDDGLDERGIPLPFDGEGQPRQRVNIIHLGTVQDAVYDRATAKKAGRRSSTGHALPPQERALGPLASNLFMAPGSTSRQALLGRARRALLVTRFWYTRLVKPRDCVMTGMTRDGLFWVEDGEVKYPVKNLRFTQSYIQALADVLAVGDTDPLLKAQYRQVYARVPALLISRFRFTS